MFKMWKAFQDYMRGYNIIRVDYEKERTIVYHMFDKHHKYYSAFENQLFKPIFFKITLNTSMGSKVIVDFTDINLYITSWYGKRTKIHLDLLTDLEKDKLIPSISKDLDRWQEVILDLMQDSDKDSKEFCDCHKICQAQDHQIALVSEIDPQTQKVLHRYCFKCFFVIPELESKNTIYTTQEPLWQFISTTSQCKYQLNIQLLRKCYDAKITTLETLKFAMTYNLLELQKEFTIDTLHCYYQAFGINQPVIPDFELINKEA